MDNIENRYKSHAYELLKEVVAVFTKIEDMDLAVDKLTSNGFNPAEVSILADRKKVKEKLGDNATIESLMDHPDTPRIGYVANENIGAAQGGLIGGLAYIGSLTAAGTVIAVGGPISAIFATAAIAGSTFATIGAVLGKLIGNSHADRMEEQLANGGISMWIKINSDEQEKIALNIMNECNANHVHSHVLEHHKDELKENLIIN